MMCSSFWYNSDGSLDNSFGNNRVVISDFGDEDRIAYAAALQTDGKIVVGGSSDQKLVSGKGIYPMVT